MDTGNRLLTIGRMVLYVHVVSADNRIECPAIVTAVRDGERGLVALSVHGLPGGVAALQDVPYDEYGRSAHTWRWMPEDGKGWFIKDQPPYEYLTDTG